MGDIIEYCIVLSIEEFKITLENARPARVLKPGSKSYKMILKRPIQNIKANESATSFIGRALNISLSGGFLNI
jgi:hypothetical protein